MATFTSFSNVLPDPIRRITDQGDIDPSGVAGPGFSGVRFSSNQDTQVSRTNSGRGVHRDQESQFWSFTIRYNPMLREQFDPVDAFLAGRNARKDPFFVVLPQYSRPKNPSFAAYLSQYDALVAGTYASGTSAFMMRMSGGATMLYPPRPGDMFTVTDPANVNHLKVYKVTAVETNARYQQGKTQPNINQCRIHISPALQRTTYNDAKINFLDPMFRVIAKSDVREYDLDTENLYSFSLDVEEIQP